MGKAEADEGKKKTKKKRKSNVAQGEAGDKGMKKKKKKKKKQKSKTKKEVEAKKRKQQEEEQQQAQHQQQQQQQQEQQQQQQQQQQREDKGEENDDKGKEKEQEQQKKKPIEYNPRWMGYSVILVSSLINLSACSNISAGDDDSFVGIWGICLAFPVFTFVLSVLVLFQDRTRLLCDIDDAYTTCDNGNLEGRALFFSVLWWIVGVTYMTQVDGIAYRTNNVYYSSWCCLICCVYTLDLWSRSKDWLSIRELTGVSATLRGWYILFFSSVVVFATCIDLYAYFADAKGDADDGGDGGGDAGDVYDDVQGDEDIYMVTYVTVDERHRNDAAAGIAFGMASAAISLGWISAHYNFVECCTEGGLLELLSSMVLSLLWVVGVALLTQDGGIGATTVGSSFSGGCQHQRRTDAYDDFMDEYFPGMEEHTDDSCVVTYSYYDPQNANTEDGMVELSYGCEEIVQQQEEINEEIERYIVPGSNLYFACWISLASSFYVIFRWKAQQVLKFAQAQQQKRQQQQQEQEQQQKQQQQLGGGGGYGDDDYEGDFGSDYDDDDDDSDINVRRGGGRGGTHDVDDEDEDDYDDYY